MNENPDNGGEKAIMHHKLIDVSSNQRGIDWAKVKDASVYGVYIKATEGASYVDPEHWSGPRTRSGSFIDKVRAARKHGLKVGLYHFARPDNNAPTDEVHNFLTHTAGVRQDLRPVLDFETAGHAFRPNMEAWAREFSQLLHQRTGLYPIFYSYPAFIAAMRCSRPIGAGLWIASYGRNDGKRHAVTVPQPWKSYKMHQYTSNGTCGGVSGHVDLNYAADASRLLLPSGT